MEFDCQRFPDSSSVRRIFLLYKEIIWQMFLKSHVVLEMSWKQRKEAEVVGVHGKVSNHH